MGFWRFLFGEPKNCLRDGKKHGRWIEETEERRREVVYEDGHKQGPFKTSYADGTRVEGTYVAGKLDGTLRVFGPSGELAEEKVYQHGKLVTGPFTEHDAKHKEWVRERGRIVNGLRDGICETFHFSKQALWTRTMWRAGQKHGSHEVWYFDGKRELAGQYEHDLSVGKWQRWRMDGSLVAEIDLGAAGGVVTWRWLRRDGTEWKAPPVADEPEAYRWVRLGDAWEDALADRTTGSFTVQLAVDGWGDQMAIPLAWIADRMAEGDHPRWSAGDAWLSAMLDRDGDPRARLIDAIEYDHIVITAERMTRLRAHASHLRELAFYECVLEPDPAALFEGGIAWPVLDVLDLEDSGPIAGVLSALASARWVALTDVAFGGHDERLREDDVRALFASPWIERIQKLRITVHRDAEAIVARALEETPLRALRELVVVGVELDESRIRERHPGLTRLELDE